MSIPQRWVGFRELPPNIEQNLGRLTPIFEQKGVQLAYLFGSLSQGRKGRDVDLALLTQDKPVFQLRPAITTCLQTERLDLVDLRQASPVLCFEIIRTGQLLYQTSEAICQQFEMSTLRLYKDTAWLRRQQRQYLKEHFKQWSSKEVLEWLDAQGLGS
jgi:predicted nucleotidyltransferase